MSRYTTTRQIKDESGKRKAETTILPVAPLSEDDIYIQVTSPERLDLLADTFYNDVDLWWIIATANPDVIRRDSYNLKPGLEIRIPLNTEEILREYENLN